MISRKKASYYHTTLQEREVGRFVEDVHSRDAGRASVGLCLCVLEGKLLVFLL